MALFAINRNPGRKELIVFGIGVPIAFGLIGWHRWTAGSELAAEIIWGVGGVLSLVFALVAPARRWLYVAWMCAVFPLAFVVSHVILGFVYFAVLTPLAFLLRALGVDPMNRSFDKRAKTYWVPRETAREKASYFRQF